MDIKQQRDQLVAVLTAAKARSAQGLEDTVERDVDGAELARSTRGRDAYHDGIQHLRHAIACLDAALAVGVTP